MQRASAVTSASTGLRLSELSHRYRDRERWAVSDLSLEVRPGELAALLGPSGCGKTTVLKIVAGLLQPTTGDVLVDDSSVLHLPPERRGVAMVFQKALLFPHMSVGANVGFGLRMRGASKERMVEAVHHALAGVHLSGFESRRPEELSGGEQQRVALARVLVTEPRVLLLDEPFSNLDTGLREDMRDLVKELQREHRFTTLFVTHDQGEAVAMADRIAFMLDGSIHMHDTPDAFYERPASRRVARFFGATNFVPGHAQNGAVTTPVGELRPAHTVPPGEVTLTIRQEAVGLGPGENSFPARVVRRTYLGTRALYDLESSGVRLRMELPPRTSLQENESVVVHLPAEALWPLSD